MGSQCLALGIAILGLADIASLRAERLFFAAGDNGSSETHSTSSPLDSGRDRRRSPSGSP